MDISLEKISDAQKQSLVRRSLLTTAPTICQATDGENIDHNPQIILSPEAIFLNKVPRLAKIRESVAFDYKTFAS